MTMVAEEGGFLVITWTKREFCDDIPFALYILFKCIHNPKEGYPNPPSLNPSTTMSPSSNPDYCTSPFPSPPPPLSPSLQLITTPRLRPRRFPNGNPPTNPRRLQTRRPKNTPRPRPLRLPRARHSHEEIPTHKRRLLHPLRRHPASGIRPRAPAPRTRGIHLRALSCR